MLTSAAISSQTSYEWDLNSISQMRENKFYGYLPRSIKLRLLCLALMFYMSTFNLVRACEELKTKRFELPGDSFPSSLTAF